MAMSNSPYGEYFVASAPGVPFSEIRLTPNMQTPQNGIVRPDDSPGFGMGLTLENITDMCV